MICSPSASLARSLAIFLYVFSSHALADESTQQPSDKLEKAILSRSPEVRVDKVDHHRLAVRRLDIVDEKGVIRLSLGAPAPAPIIDGIQYKRTFSVSGLTIFDKDGNERGGYGVADVEGTAVVAAQDHVNGDAIGWRIMPDGSVTFQINERSTVKREAALGGRIAPGSDGATRIKMTVAADGTPAIALADKQDKPRLRLTVTEQGFGAIEFLDAAGKVVDSFVPELRRSSK